MWILSGKVIVALVWTFWMIVVGATAEGNPADKVIVEPEQVREEYRQQRKDKTFAQCWPANNDSFYEWCSQYLHYQHITKKNRKKNGR